MVEIQPKNPEKQGKTTEKSPIFEVNLAGIPLKSPLLNASGTFNPDVFNQLNPLVEGLGAIVTKTVTPLPRAGNAQHRTAEVPGLGMLNSIGLQNPGLARTLDDVIPHYSTFGPPIILSISADSAEGFGDMARTIETHPNGHQVAALELNLSCPNVHAGGIHFGVSPAMVQDALKAATTEFSRPVFAKLTPNVPDIAAIGEAAVEGGAHGITAINTLLGARINIKKRSPYLARVSGGYSGPAVRPVAIHSIWNLRKRLPHIPIIGVGGIATAEDMIEFAMAGATVVQLGTSCYRSPNLFHSLLADVAQWMDQEGVGSWSELIGAAHSA